MSLTVKEALQRASFQLQLAKLAEPRRESEVLLCAVLQQTRAWLYAHGEAEIPPAAADLFGQWLQRRSKGEPYAYLCGEKEFMGLPFTVTPSVLIPRPETEVLVETVLGELKKVKQPHLLELGTGSGAIAVSLAIYLPQATITAVDISAAALAVARSNAERHQVGSRLRFLLGDLYAPVAHEEYTAVVSNPPYVPSADILRLADTVKAYEPRLALDGGTDGLNFYRRLTAELTMLSAAPPLLAMEVGLGQAAAVAELCHSAGYGQVAQIADLAGIPRVILAKLI
ncbi:MAG TPA: peptide chain release factor N(5)-glutamine methyltransferase [Oscillospiraceae bacterium]|nr:peptide chain release factor N(5)-glutamine methyltransferase [Oscillospiraceae bacterium]